MSFRNQAQRAEALIRQQPGITLLDNEAHRSQARLGQQAVRGALSQTPQPAFKTFHTQMNIPIGREDIAQVGSRNLNPIEASMPVHDWKHPQRSMSLPAVEPVGNLGERDRPYLGRDGDPVILPNLRPTPGRLQVPRGEGVQTVG